MSPPVLKESVTVGIILKVQSSWCICLSVLTLCQQPYRRNIEWVISHSFPFLSDEEFRVEQCYEFHP
jgi:hypothetical protein